MSEEITTPEVSPTEEPAPAAPAPPPAPEGVVLTPQATRNLKGLVNEVRRIKKLMGARALENKPTNDLEDVLDSISEKILWCLETEVGL